MGSDQLTNPAGAFRGRGTSFAVRIPLEQPPQLRNFLAALVQAAAQISPQGLGENSSAEVGNQLRENLHGGQVNLSQAFASLDSRQGQALQERFGSSFDELLSLSQEIDPEMFAAGLLLLGRRALDRQDFGMASVVFQFLGEAPEGLGFTVPAEIRREALQEEQAMRGEGGFGLRFEFLSRRFLTELTSPVTLASMTGAQALFGFARWGLWTRLMASPSANLLSRGLGAEIISGLGAFSLEAPAFVGLHHGLNALAGIPQANDLGSLLSETRGTYLQLGALRGFGWLGRQAFRTLHGVDALGRLNQLEGFSALSSKILPQAAMFGGIYFAQKIEGRPGSTTFADSLVTFLQFNASGVLASHLLGPNWEIFMNRMQIPHVGGRNPFRLNPELVTPEGFRMNLPEDSMEEVRNLSSMMVGQGEGSGRRPERSSPLSKVGDSRIFRVQIEQLIRGIFPDYFENLHRLPSDLSLLDAQETAQIEARLQEYLDEGQLQQFHPQDPIVADFKSRIWRRNAPSQSAASPRVEQTLRQIQDAHAGLGQLEFADGSRYLPSALKWARNLSRLLDRDIYYFDDTARTTGSFKERGALVEALRARDEGVLHLVTASHGNHGLAVALAAQKLGLRSTIVVPHTTPRVKIEALENLGATVVTTNTQPWRGYEESRDWGLRYTFERNSLLESFFGLQGTLRYIHGFEDVIPGQGVAGLEMLEQIQTLPAEMPRRFANANFLIPMGGGGLAAGVATALKSQMPQARVIGVASSEAPALHFSLLNGARAEIYVNERSLCDSGIGLSIPGKRPFELLPEVLDVSMAVSDPLVGEAMRLLHRHEGLTVEGAAATGLAALLDPRFSSLELDSKTPLVLFLTGRNIDGLRHEAVMEGREAFLPGGVLHEEKPWLAHLAPLLTAIRGGESDERIDSLLRKLSLDKDWVRRTARLSDQSMARTHLVVEHGVEIDLLAFKDGQVAPAHDHGGSRGWNKIMEGEMVEAIFEMNAEGQLTPKEVRHHRADDVSEMPTDLIHEVYNRQGEGRSLIALQIYLPSINFQRMRNFPQQSP